MTRLENIIKEVETMKEITCDAVLLLTNINVVDVHFIRRFMDVGLIMC